jgi:hypothetical protein
MVPAPPARWKWVTPQTTYPYGHNNQLDFRMAKEFSVRERWKIEPTMDFFNLFNANSILSINTSYNTTTAGNAGAWRNVTGFLPGCLIKFGVHVDF